MKMPSARLWAVVCALAAAIVIAAPAQTQEVKEKPRMYSYVANWVIPRAQWGEMQKAAASGSGVMEKALANGTIIGYGTDENLVHQPDTETHDNWWSAMSMGDLLTVLDQIYQSGNAVVPVFQSATKHWDNVYVSKYYNRRPGSFKNAYTYVAFYPLKRDAPDDAVESLSKNLVAPLLEKMLADGVIIEYEIDEQAIHTDSPDSFVIAYIAPQADGIDKVNAAIRENGKTDPLSRPAFGSMVDYSGHRDELFRSSGTFK